MGGNLSSLSCLRLFSLQVTYDDEDPQYDMAPVQAKNLPCVWMIGQPNTGKRTHGELIERNYEFDHVNVTELLRAEAEKDTERGKIVSTSLKQQKKTSDSIVINLLKERLLESENENGYIITNFPRTAKQADMFVKEIGNVNFVFYLYCDIVTLLERARQRSATELDENSLKRDFIYATREIKLSLGKFVNKTENVNTSGSTSEIFNKIRQIFARRLHLGAEILAEGVTTEETLLAVVPPEKGPEEIKEPEVARVKGDNAELSSDASMTKVNLNHEDSCGSEQNVNEVVDEFNKTGDYAKQKEAPKEDEIKMNVYIS